MLAYYPLVKSVHIGAVAASGLVFLLRGLLVQFGRTGVAMAPPVRYASYAIDTVLLTAALMLMTIVRQYPGADAWLTVKVSLVVAYIALGYYALGRVRARSHRRAPRVAPRAGRYDLQRRRAAARVVRT